MSSYASGGTSSNYTSNNVLYYLNIFSNVGTSTFTVSNILAANILIVAGGGGGGLATGGGGGAGGYQYYSSQILYPGSYQVTVGGGGAGGNVSTGNGTNGSNSVFGVLPASIGGGGGANRFAGGLGGSGGGGAGSLTAGSGTAGQGYAGGGSINGGNYEAGGGGGAGAPGASGVVGTPGVGGIGLQNSMTGIPVYYAGGGGGGWNGSAIGANGGLGGGGAGGSVAISGTSNTGGGGGGNNNVAGNVPQGGNGGSGIVIIQFSQISVIINIPSPVVNANLNNNAIISYITSLSPLTVTGSAFATYATLTWQSSTNASYYTVTATSNTSNTLTQITSNNNIIFTGLSSNTSYNFTITPYNSFGISNVSITTSNVTTPIQTTSSDPYINNVVLLVHADTTFADTSFNNATLTLTGSTLPTISTVQKKFGIGSILYTKLAQNNPGQDAITPLSSVYYLGTNNFTMECWVYFNTITTYSFSLFQSVAGTNQAGFTADANATRVTFFGGGGSVYQSAVTTGVWHHLAVCRSGTTFYGFYDGAAPNNGGSTWTSALPIGGTGTDQFAIGCPPGGGFSIDGYVDEVRVTNGYARYTAPFTPPIAAFPDYVNIPTASNIISGSNTITYVTTSNIPYQSPITFSSASNAITSAITPTTPTQITGTLYSTTYSAYAALSWQSSVNTIYYKVTSTPTTTTQITYTPSIIFTGLSPVTSYTFTITPYNSQNIIGSPSSYSLTYTLIYTILYSMTFPFTFTTLGASGGTAPSSLSSYSSIPGNSTSYVMTLNNGIQFWTIPTTGTYQIIAAGAGQTNAGYGIIVSNTYYLTGGTILAMLVGQAIGNGVGGSGGTFVTLYNNASISTYSPILIAGGGGGVNTSVANSSANAVATTTGGSGGGTGGMGGGGNYLVSSGGGGFLGLGGSGGGNGEGGGPAFMDFVNRSLALTDTSSGYSFGGGSGGVAGYNGNGAGGGYSGGGTSAGGTYQGGGGSYDLLGTSTNATIYTGSVPSTYTSQVASGYNNGAGFVSVNYTGTTGTSLGSIVTFTSVSVNVSTGTAVVNANTVSGAISYNVSMISTYAPPGFGGWTSGSGITTQSVTTFPVTFTGLSSDASTYYRFAITPVYASGNGIQVVTGVTYLG